MTEATIEALKVQSHRLEALLKDPHPGLQTWNRLTEAVLDEIAVLTPKVLMIMERQ